MSDENTNKNQNSGVKTDPKLIKKLESDLKSAFKETRFDDLKKIADELKKADPGNHLADRIVEKMESIKAESIKVANAAKIKLLEQHMEDAFKSGRLMDLAKIASEIKKMDPENKPVKKIEARIEKAKAALDAQVKKEQIRGLEIVIKSYLKDDKFDEAVKKANELLLLDKGNSLAAKALKIAGKAKNIEKKPEVVTPAVVIVPSVKKEVVTKGPGFFARLFKKKDVKPEVKTKEISPIVGPVFANTKPAEIKDAVKPATKKPEIIIPLAKKDVVSKPGFFSQLFKKKEVKPDIKTKEIVAKIAPVISNTVEQKKSIEVPKAVVQEKKPEVIIPSVKKDESVKSAGIFGNMFKKQEVKEVKPEISKKEALSKAISAIMGQSAPVAQVKPVAAPVKSTEIKSVVIAEAPKVVVPVKPVEEPKKVEALKVVTPIIPVSPAVQAPQPNIFKPTVPVKAPIMAFKPEDVKSVSKEPEAEKVITIPLTTPTQNPEVKVIKPVISDSQSDKGNIFTKLFGKKDEVSKPTGSIIETIVAQSGQSVQVKEEDKHKREDDTGESFLKHSVFFLKVSFTFIIISAGFFYSYNNPENRVLSLIGIENNGIQLKSAATELDSKKTEKEDLDKDINRYKKGYENEYKATIDKIVANRLDWPSLISKLNEVTESVYEKNALAQYVQYNNYSYDVKTGQLTVNATLSDPLGKNLTKLAELEDAFTYYPKDKNNSNDKTEPYFYGFEGFRSYAKSFNKATGRYASNFSLSLSTRPSEKNKNAKQSLNLNK